MSFFNWMPLCYSSHNENENKVLSWRQRNKIPVTDIMLFWTAGISYIYLILISFIVQAIGTFLHHGRSLAGHINHFYVDIVIIVNVITCWESMASENIFACWSESKSKLFLSKFCWITDPRISNWMQQGYTREEVILSSTQFNDSKTFYQSDMPLVWMDLIDMYMVGFWTQESYHIFAIDEGTTNMICFISRAVAELERRICTSGIWNGRRQPLIGVKSTMPSPRALWNSGIRLVDSCSNSCASTWDV